MSRVDAIFCKVHELVTGRPSFSGNDNFEMKAWFFWFCECLLWYVSAHALKRPANYRSVIFIRPIIFATPHCHRVRDPQVCRLSVWTRLKETRLWIHTILGFMMRLHSYRNLCCGAIIFEWMISLLACPSTIVCLHFFLEFFNLCSTPGVNRRTWPPRNFVEGGRRFSR